MRGQSGIITLTLSAMLIGGCATQSDVMRGNKIDPYQNTDRPLIPYENANRPIMALDLDAREYVANSPWRLDPAIVRPQFFKSERALV